jgi:hypothetical protein
MIAPMRVGSTPVLRADAPMVLVTEYRRCGHSARAVCLINVDRIARVRIDSSEDPLSRNRRCPEGLALSAVSRIWWCGSRTSLIYRRLSSERNCVT